MSILLACVVVLAFALVFLGVYLPQTAPDPVRSRLTRFAERTRTLEEIELEQPFTERVLRPTMAYASRIMQRLLRKKKGQTDDSGLNVLQKRLLLAGNPNNLSAHDFLGIIGMCMLGLSGLIFILMGLSGADVPTSALVALVGLALGYFLPTFWLSAKIRGRQKEIERAMPDALDLLVISVEAGLGFDAAVHRLTEKSDHALAREFRRVIAEVRMGRPRREALRDMVNRTEVPDLNTFVAAIIQADQLGVSVSRVLSVQADQMRMLRRQRAEEAAAKAPLKMLFPMVLLIFPSMFIVILGPSIVTMLVGEGGGGF
jgi:tight adherence protein C